MTLRGKTIDEVLTMSVEEGVTSFAVEPAVGKKIEVLCDLGLSDHHDWSIDRIEEAPE